MPSMHDRHGRGWRADADARHRPPEGFRVRDRRRFARLVADATAGLGGELRAAVDAATLVLTDVPPVDGPAGVVDLAGAGGGPGTDAEPDDPPLVEYDAERRLLVVYRRPLEARATGRADLVMFIRAAIGREVAEALGIDDGWDDWD